MMEMVKDVYEWCVVYHDGEALHEYDHPDGYAWKDVENKPVKEVWLLLPDQEPIYGHHVAIPEKAETIFFRRRYIPISLSGGDGRVRRTVHCIGWKNENQGVYLFVFENGSTLVTDNLQAV